VWLATDDKGILCVLSKPNAATPLTEGLTPLLAIDVWEHAYYIDHRNLRADGVKALWEVLDWKIIEERYDAR
jgi:Fe-Mn family superoxide dismutase